MRKTLATIRVSALLKDCNQQGLWSDMKLTADTDSGTVTIEDAAGSRTVELWSQDGFQALADLWLKVGWNQKYSYAFTWFGRPLIQLPEDVIRMQEAIFALKPDVIVETGVAHGGSAIFMASLCEALGRGRVISIDIEIRAHNRQAIESDPLAHRITLIEGDSAGPDTVAQVRELCKPGERVMVILDSDHSYDHVMRELEAYAPLVSPGSLLVATDGVMEDLADTPLGEAEWAQDNPARAARDFAAARSDFTLESPPRPFDESAGTVVHTYYNSAWLRRAV